MKFLKITTNYPEYNNYYYCHNPEMLQASYDIQKHGFEEDGFFWEGHWGKGFQKWGYETKELIWNAAPLQRAWAIENNLRKFDKNFLSQDELEEITLQQTIQFRPEIIWLHHWSASFLKKIRENVKSLKLVIGWTGSNVPPSCMDFFHSVDIMFSCAPESVGKLSKFRDDTYLMHHWFIPEAIKNIAEPCKTNKISFLGGLKIGDSLHNGRINLLEQIQKSFGIAIYSSEETTSKTIEEIRQPGVFGKRMFQILMNSQIVLNIHADSSPIFASNLRMFEVTGVGACLLTDWRSNLHKFFKPEVEVATYKGIDDCLRNIDKLLCNPELLNQVAQSGNKRCLSEHTFDNRLPLFNHIIHKKIRQQNKLLPFKNMHKIKSEPIFQGPISEALHFLKKEIAIHPRKKAGIIIIDGIKLQYADLHSFYHELDQIFAQNIYGFSTKNPHPIIIDCGAHVGLASIYFSKTHPSAQIHAFEADPEIFKILNHNIESTGASNITTHNKAIWTHDHGVNFLLSGDDSGHISKDANDSVPSIRLHVFLDTLKNIDLLKIDIEGAEVDVLADSFHNLDRVQRIIVEVHILSDERPSLGKLFNTLEMAGFYYTISDLHSATWIPCKEEPPFTFINHDKFIMTVFAWKKGLREISTNTNEEGHYLGNIHQFCMQDFGGAGTAALRLHEGLLNLNMSSTFHVQNIQKWTKNTTSLSSHSNEATPNKKFLSPEWRAFLDLNHKTLAAYPNRPNGLEMFSLPWAATHLDHSHNISNSDIIHFHWISGTVGIPQNIDFLKNKKIVWTLHDMNPFTGGCHYAGTCTEYQKNCGKCPQLASKVKRDLSYEIWKLKKIAYRLLDITVVAPSQWLSECAKKSSLFSSFPTHVIPNAVPTDVFKPYPQKQIRESLKILDNSFVVLFGADSLINERKGFRYLLQTLDVLKNEHKQDNIILAVFGKSNDIATQHLGYQTICFDYVEKDSELAMIYSMADVTVIPSLEDNLPNIVLESLACGTPVVGFNVGGIPDMVDHLVNGFLASTGDAHSLAEGILWVKNQDQNKNKLRLKCRETALTKYNLLLNAKRYIELYNITKDKI